MPKYTDEQVERAKNVDVRTFLEQTEGYAFEGHGRYVKCQNPECTGQPSSLSVDTRLNRIFYNSMTGNRPLSAVDWCMKIKDMDFQSSMQLVLGENPQDERVEKPKYQQHKAQENANTYEPKNLELSEKSDVNSNVIAYLCKTRAIPSNIVYDCINQNLIYQDVRKNAVFVGYDSENKIPKYAARRGTFTPDGKEPFKRDCSGSDKNFAFRLEGKSCETIYVAEAAIDVLSLAALEDKFNGSGAYKEKTYLSTGGAGIDNALEQFCKTHDVKTINICFDNDEAGKNGMDKIMQKFRERGYTVNDMRASLAHDYNDELVSLNNDPNFYSKPPDVVKSVNENNNERNDIMPEQNMSASNENEYVKKALDEITSHYECVYSRKDLESLPDSDKKHIADLYNERPYDENNPATWDMNRKLDGDIYEAININTFKQIINADSLKQQGIEIDEIRTKKYIRDDFCYEPSMSDDDLDYSFSETIQSISFKNEDKETVAFSSYSDLKNALSDPDSKLMRSAARTETENFIPFDDYSAPIQEIKPDVQPQPSKQPESNVQLDKQENQALFSIEQYGEVYYYRTEKTANELLHISANSERPFAEMMNQGERISEDRYAEIMQSDKLKFAVDFNFDSKSANILAVNNGRGGIAESDRNPQNTSYKKANLSVFVKKEAHRNIPEPEKNTVSERTAEPETKSAVLTQTQDERKVQSEISPAVHSQPQMQPEKELSHMESAENTNALLASLKDRQEKKRAVLLDKADKIDGKLADRKERINNLNKKISDIETSIKTAEAFKRVFGKTAIGGLIDKNTQKKQAKIKQIQEVKIPKQETKINKLNDKKTKVTNKLEKTNNKIQRIDKVQGFISAVGSKDKETRHKGFVTGLSELSEIRRESLEKKLTKVQGKIDMLSANISSPDLSNLDRLKLQNEITNLKKTSSDIADKIGSTLKLRNDLEDMKNGRYSEHEIEAAVSRTAENISAKLDSSDTPESKGIVNHIISQTVESGNEAVSEITAQKSAERAEKAKPDLDRERVPKEREPEVTGSTEQQILTSIAAVTGVSISELNRLPVELKADIIADFKENNGNMRAEKLAEIICETIDIKQPVQEQKQPEKNNAEHENKANDTRKAFEENVKNSSTSVNDKKEKQTDKELNKPLFSRSAIMGDKYKPTSSKSAEDIERDRQNKNREAAI